MAQQEDFCFMFYDGEATRDVSHMDRLERGGYYDLVIAQRKFGHMTIQQIEKVLGKDFQSIWPSIELIMKRDEVGKYFIQWVDNSVEQRKKHSARQKQNAEKRWQKVKENDAMALPLDNSGIATAMPLINKDIDKDITKEEEERGMGKGEETILATLLDAKTLEAAEMNQFTHTGKKNTEFIKSQWDIFKMERNHDPPFKQREYFIQPAKLYSHFLNWIRNKFPKNNGSNQGNHKPIPIKNPAGGFGKL